MSTKIIMTLEETLTDAERDKLRGLLQDAFYEFAGSRTPARVYVAERYPANERTPYPIGPKREAKVAEVEQRIHLAQKLHQAAFTMEAVIDPPREFALLNSYAEGDAHAVVVGIAEVTKQYRVNHAMTCKHVDGNGDLACHRKAQPGTERCMHHTETVTSFKGQL